MAQLFQVNEDYIFEEDLQRELNKSIHTHCNSCIFIKCKVEIKNGYVCEIVTCPYGCNHQFHKCKMTDHELLCLSLRIPCINLPFGCPHVVQRKFMSNHLIICPASIIVCNAEWNRWAIGARERERITSAKGASYHFDPDDLDMCLAINDQRMVNEMHNFPKYVRKLMCNDITKRFPSLPLMARGSYHEDHSPKLSKDPGRSTSTTDDDEESLTPGLSFSVCSELTKGNKRNESIDSLGSSPFLGPSNNCNSTIASVERKSSRDNADDISAKCCTHGILKSLCQFCKNDPDDPDFKYGTVWREKLDLNFPASIEWKKEVRIEKIRKRGPLGIYSYKRFDEIEDEEDSADNEGTGFKENEQLVCNKFRFQTPPPVPLTPQGLILEVGLKHYSRHQVKPKPMFTFQCMEVVRRDEFASHYQNVHSEIQEGLDGWFVQRCPLHIIGCPFSTKKFFPGIEGKNDIIYCHVKKAFGITSNGFDRSFHSCSSAEKSVSSLDKLRKMFSIPEDQQAQFLASGDHITTMPYEVLQRIIRNLDGFSLNSLSLTCKLFREVCQSLLDEKGLVIQEWIRLWDDGKIRWKLGTKKWFFSKCFEPVHHWSLQNEGIISNHLSQCPFNDRKTNSEKFQYLSRKGLKKYAKYFDS